MPKNVYIVRPQVKIRNNFQLRASKNHLLSESKI
jgi:hypothetical protein